MSEVKHYKELVQDQVNAISGRLIEMSDWLYQHPEFGCEEGEASKLLADELVKHGFKVEKPFLNMPTAFKASYSGKGSGPKVAILAEYDALEGIGHGCGHNIIGTGAIGAGIALTKVMKELSGKIIVLGCPAEENRKGGPPGGWPCQFSKQIMCDKGVFDNIDAAIMIHPTAGITEVGRGALIAQYIDVVFHGKSAHAAADPWTGRNALQAALLFLNGVNAFRQQLRRGRPYTPVIHWILTEGGTAGNVIPEIARCYGACRSEDKDYLEAIVEAVRNCAKGAALMTGCEFDFVRRRMTSREPGTPNLCLAELGYQNLLKLGVETEDWRVSTRKEPAGSTDFSDVTKKVPSLEISISISKDEIPWHSVTAAKATISELGHRALIDGAKALAMTAVDLFAIPENLQKAKSTHLMDLDKYLTRSTS